MFYNLMKRILFLTGALFLFCCSNAQSWVWAKRQTGGSPSGSYEGWSVHADVSGNAFITGNNLGTLILGTNTLSAGGYIAKYDPSGNVLWAKNASGAEGFSISSDLTGNSFLTGLFSGSVTSFGTYTVSNNGAMGTSDAFLAKFDVNGNPLWLKSIGGTAMDQGNVVSADQSGNTFIGGYYASSSMTVGTNTLVNTSTNNDIFLIKYDPSGNVLWAKSFGNSADDRLYGLSTDIIGNVIATGFYKSATITFGTYTLTNSGSGGNIFIVKYDPNGNVIWATNSVGTGSDVGFSVSTISSGDIFVAGYYESPSISFGTYALSNVGYDDAFVAKYDKNGNAQWVRRIGGSAYDIAHSISSVGGDIFVVGSLGSPSIALTSYTLVPPTGSTDPMFMIQYDLNGNETYATALASGDDDCVGVSVDNFCNAYVGGDFYASPYVLGTNTLTPILGCVPGCETIFMAKFSFNCQPDLVNEKEKHLNMFVNPNPNNGIFEINSAIELTGTIEIYDVNGKLIYTGEAKQSNKINITSQVAGIYSVVVKDEKGVLMKTTRIVKE
jgi:hypothetical protein